MNEVLVMVAIAALVFGAHRAWHFFTGETVGEARGLQQGDHSVPGASARAVVKRTLVRGRPGSVELTFWVLGIPKSFRLDPREATELAQALEAAVAEIRGAE